MQRRSSYFAFNYTPLFDQFTDFFENSLGIFTTRLTDTYTGPCLRIMHASTLIEVDIGFEIFEGAYWIDNAAIADFLTDQGEGELLITRGYLQGLTETGSLFAVNAFGIFPRLVLGDTPKLTHIAIQESGMAFRYFGNRRKNIRESSGLQEYNYNDKYKALDLFVIDESYTNVNFHNIQPPPQNFQIVRTESYSLTLSNTSSINIRNNTDDYPIGQRMNADIPFSESDKRGVVATYHDYDGVSGFTGRFSRVIYKDWKGKLTQMTSNLNDVRPNIRFVGNNLSEIPDFKCYGYLRAHEVEDNFTGIDPDKLLEINRAINRIYGIVENEYIGI
jgi:hypothetical protein